MSIAAQLAPIVLKDANKKFLVAAKEMAMLVDKKCPKDTGFLESSRYVTYRLGPLMSVTIIYTAPYAEYQDKPVAVINAKNHKYLKFKIGSHWVQVVSVKVNQKNKGWFSDTVKTWPAVLRAAF